MRFMPAALVIAGVAVQVAQAAEPITHIASASHARIKLVPIGPKQHDSFTVSRSSQSSINAFVRGHTLYIKDKLPGEANHRNSDVTVYLHTLREINADHATSITGTHLVSPGLVVTANNRGNIDLKGNIVLNRINAQGPTNIDIRWVKSNAMEIMAGGSAHITLAGITHYVRARLTDHSTLNSEYLRSQDTIVQTRDYSSAKVNPTVTLRAFAFDNSTIYYYKQPKNFSRFTSGAGNILQMDWRR